jgi:DNA-binding CsgD family transcriptional regulator
MMFPWRRLLHQLITPRLAIRPDPVTLQQLRQLAAQERRPLEDVTLDLLTYALDHKLETDLYSEIWRRLSPREQEVCALVCLNNTNPQIASILSISDETVKTHVRNILSKFNLSRKADLRRALERWDFSDFEPS